MNLPGLAFLNLGQSIIVSSVIPELEIGDVILGGKWKNKRMVIEGFGTDSNGQPILKTDKGDYPVFKFRLEKLMPKKSVK